MSSCCHVRLIVNSVLIVVALHTSSSLATDVFMSSGYLFGFLVRTTFSMLAHFLLFTLLDQRIGSIAHNLGLLRPMIFSLPVVLVTTATAITTTTTNLLLLLLLRILRLNGRRLLAIRQHFLLGLNRNSWCRSRVAEVSSAPVRHETIVATTVLGPGRTRVTGLGCLIDSLDLVFGRSCLSVAHLLVVLLVKVVKFAGTHVISTTHLGAHHLRESTALATTWHIEGALGFLGLLLIVSLPHACDIRLPKDTRSTGLPLGEVEFTE